MVELNTSEEVKPSHRLGQSLLREFEDVFPNNLSAPGLPSLRGIKYQIDLVPRLLYQINQLIGVIQMSEKFFDNKYKSCLTMDTLRKV